MKINIIGASGAGTTTLGLALAKETSLPFFDSDNYYWEDAGAGFNIRRDPPQRNELLLHDLAAQPNWLLGGPVMSWDLPPLPFDLVVFLHIPPKIRMQRLKQRELERYGDIIYTDAHRNQKFNDFINWAASYDDNSTPTSRTINNQRAWLRSLTCPVIEIIGDKTVEERVALVLKKLND